MKITAFLRGTLFLSLLGLVVIALFPLVCHDNYLLRVLMFVAINTVLAVSLNLLMGYAGQASLGHAAFFGIGAYTSAILTTTYHCNPWLALLIGIALTCLVAYAIGMPCLRLRGHYLAMATLGFGWIVYMLMVHWSAMTHGTSGIESIPKLSIGTFVIADHLTRFYLTGAVMVLALAISANVVNSRIGRALRALHGGETAAATLGIDTARAKLQVFVLSAGMAAVAGSLYAHCVNYISPSSFGFGFSVQLVVMVVIGGMASVWGAPLGATLITMLSEWLRGLSEYVPFLRDFDVVIHGAILVLVMIFLPSGLVVGLRDAVWRIVRKRRRPTTTDRAPEVAST